MSHHQPGTTEARRPALVYDLGVLDYEEAFRLQRRLQDQRIAGAIPDTLLLLEHPPVITVGRSGNMDNVRVQEDQLARHGVRLHHTNRGGDVTYHGPGQLVGYTIIDLKPYGLDLREHLRRIEQVIIHALQPFGIAGSRKEGLTGVWVGEAKIASIGLHVKQWVTTHGFALNVDPDLENFSLIYPCGIRDGSMTSMARVLGHTIDSGQVRQEVAKAFAQVFGLHLRKGQ